MSDGLFVRVMDCFAAVEWLLWALMVAMVCIDFSWVNAVAVPLAVIFPVAGNRLAVKARR